LLAPADHRGPLLCFAAAANRLPLSTVGLLQFLTPILQLAAGVFIAHETVPGTEWAGFGLVWLALALLTYDSLGQVRKAGPRRARQTVREVTTSQSASSVSLAEFSGRPTNRSRASSAYRATVSLACSIAGCTRRAAMTSSPARPR